MRERESFIIISSYFFVSQWSSRRGGYVARDGMSELRVGRSATGITKIRLANILPEKDRDCLSTNSAVILRLLHILTFFIHPTHLWANIEQTRAHFSTSNLISLNNLFGCLQIKLLNIIFINSRR